MPFTSKQKADYIELINELLDKIRVTKPTDFDNVVTDLGKILSFSESGAANFHPELKNEMDFILDAFQNPDMYVQSRSDDAEYQQIIKDRIAAKMHEFTSFTPEQKQEYIENQQRMRNQAAAYQEIMAAGESRRADAERIQQQERDAFIAEQHDIERQISRQQGSRSPDFFNSRMQRGFHDRHEPEDEIRRHEERMANRVDIDTLVSRGLLTEVARGSLMENERYNLNAENVVRLIVADPQLLSIADARGLTEHERYNLQAGNVYQLITGGQLSIADARGLTEHERYNLQAGNVYQLITGGQLSIADARGLTEHERYNLQAGNVYQLITGGQLSIADARGLTEHERYNLQAGNVYQLITGGQLSISDARGLEEQQRYRIQAGEDISTIIQRGGHHL